MSRIVIDQASHRGHRCERDWNSDMMILTHTLNRIVSFN